MTEITLAATFNVANIKIGKPVFTQTGANLVEAQAGDIVVRLTGSFTYDSDGVSGGVLTGIEALVRGTTIVTISDFSIDGSQIATIDSEREVNQLLKSLLDGSDTFLGSNRRDFFGGLGGADTLDGRGGNDRLNGGAGNDRLIGGSEDDRLIGGAGRDWLSGDSGRDKLDGGSAADKLFGGDGSDILHGGTGNDKLNGGAGGDVFVMARNGGRDTVTDFNAADGDGLKLDRDLWDGRMTAAEVIDAFAKVTGKGDTVLRFDDGERLTLKNVVDLDAVEDAISFFG